MKVPETVWKSVLVVKKGGERDREGMRGEQQFTGGCQLLLTNATFIDSMRNIVEEKGEKGY